MLVCGQRWLVSNFCLADVARSRAHDAGVAFVFEFLAWKQSAPIFINAAGRPTSLMRWVAAAGNAAAGHARSSRQCAPVQAARLDLQRGCCLALDSSTGCQTVQQSSAAQQQQPMHARPLSWADVVPAVPAVPAAGL